MNKCPAASVYTFVPIGGKRKQTGVKCVFKGTIHDQFTVIHYCLGRFDLCPIYRKYVRNSVIPSQISLQKENEGEGLKKGRGEGKSGGEKER